MMNLAATHLDQLLQLNRAHLRELSARQPPSGIATPTHITVQLAEYRQTIAQLEQRLRAALPLHNLPTRDYERLFGRQEEQGGGGGGRYAVCYCPTQRAATPSTCFVAWA